MRRLAGIIGQRRGSRPAPVHLLSYKTNARKHADWLPYDQTDRGVAKRRTEQSHGTTVVMSFRAWVFFSPHKLPQIQAQVSQSIVTSLQN